MQPWKPTHTVGKFGPPVRRIEDGQYCGPYSCEFQDGEIRTVPAQKLIPIREFYRDKSYRTLDQSVFEGQPPEITAAAVDYDGTLKFGKNVTNLRFTWASECWRGADFVTRIKNSGYKPLTSIQRISTDGLDILSNQLPRSINPHGHGPRIDR